MPQIVTDRPNGRKKVEFVCEGPSITEQSHKEEVNINSIMAKYHRTGLLPTYGNFPTYGDFSATGTYQEACDQVLAAQEMFAALPSQLRKRFANDPGKLIEFLNDPGNVDEAVELGLVNAPPPVPAAPEAVDGPPAESEPGGADGGTPVATPSASV